MSSKLSADLLDRVHAQVDELVTSLLKDNALTLNHDHFDDLADLSVSDLLLLSAELSNKHNLTCYKLLVVEIHRPVNQSAKLQLFEDSFLCDLPSVREPPSVYVFKSGLKDGIGGFEEYIFPISTEQLGLPRKYSAKIIWRSFRSVDERDETCPFENEFVFQ